MKVLFIVPYPSEGASNRLRVEQYLPYLEKEGIGYRIRPFVGRRFYKILYTKGHKLAKIFYFILSILNRTADIFRAAFYDLIFIHREALPVGSAIIETIFSKLGKKIIFDFDDAIFLPNASKINDYLERLKNPNKVSTIIGLSDYVIAGNKYLEEYARKFNNNTVVIPTPIDTAKYKPVEKVVLPGHATVGWIGSFTTRVYLDDLRGAFKTLKAKYPGLKLKFVGNWSELKDKIEGAEYKEWRLEDELSDIRSFDIGIMPMPNDMWTRGKCGFKIILYMACGLPVVSSPVGVNVEMIQDGDNGFLADSQEGWIDRLSAMIESEELRKRLGMKGREIAEKSYSAAVTASHFTEVLKKVCLLDKK